MNLFLRIRAGVNFLKKTLDVAFSIVYTINRVLEMIMIF